LWDRFARFFLRSPGPSNFDDNPTNNEIFQCVCLLSQIFPSRIRRWNPFMGLNQLVAFAPAQDGSRGVGKLAIR
jgi:hypothetical protein